MKEEIKTAFKIWGIVWTTIFLTSSFVFLLAQLTHMLNYNILSYLFLIGILLIGSFYLTLSLIIIFKE